MTEHDFMQCLWSHSFTLLYTLQSSIMPRGYCTLDLDFVYDISPRVEHLGKVVV